MGWEAVKHDLSRSDPEGWARAEAKVAESPSYGKELAQSLIEKPRPISKEEANALAIDRQRIRTERRAAFDESERAIDAGDTEGAAQARMRADRLDEEMGHNDQAARHASHEWGQGGRGLQSMANEDYSMAALVQRAKVKKGEALTHDERILMEAHAADIEKREAAVAEREAQVRAAEAKPRSPRIAKDASTRFDQLAEQMKQASRKILCEVA